MANKKNKGMYTFLWLILLGAVGVAIAGLVIALENQKKLKEESFHEGPCTATSCVHGKCNHMTGQCMCGQGWFGPNCNIQGQKESLNGIIPSNICDPPCVPGMGLCNYNTGTCDCFPGYSGPTCDL